MLQHFIHHLTTYAPLAEEEIEFIKENIPIETFKKGTVLLEEGTVSTAFYFIISGCVRLYYSVDGEEKTAFFYTEDQFISSYESFTKQSPAKHNLQCIEDTQVAVISAKNAYELLNRFPKFEFLGRVMMEEELIIYQEMISNFITLNPEQRYLKLLETNPGLIQRIPQHQLATFLGVKAESLSRIRKRILEKRKS